MAGHVINVENFSGAACRQAGVDYGDLSETAKRQLAVCADRMEVAVQQDDVDVINRECRMMLFIANAEKKRLARN